MCGIFGVFVSSKSYLKSKTLKRISIDLLDLSEKRGKDASGIATITKVKVNVVKRNCRASILKKTSEFKEVLNSAESNFIANQGFNVFGHCRMETDGACVEHTNNQPVVTNDSVLIHNGIIVNYTEIFESNRALTKKLDVDSEIISKLLDNDFKSINNEKASFKRLFELIKGNASICYFNKHMNKVFLASNNGSLYVGESEYGTFFASEKNMLLKTLLEKNRCKDLKIVQLNSGKVGVVDLNNAAVNFYNITDLYFHDFGETKGGREIEDFVPKRLELNDSNKKIFSTNTTSRLENLLLDRSEDINKLKRCSSCLIPETFPGIYFNKDDKCSLCQNWNPIQYNGKKKFNELLNKHRSKDKAADVLLPLSGGRDSCFALHYLKEQGMRPIVYTYDWGMVTDLARRNISRMTSQLEVEHILISADIRKKRENIKKNLSAWLKRPSLGTIPLFMAGDKQFFYYAKQLKKDFNLGLLLFGMNPLERTDFKVAFAGVNENKKEDRHYQLSTANKLKIAQYYTKEYFLNPSYVNSSLIDTLGAFLSYYFIKHDYEIFFEHYPWNEEEINSTLINTYDWEVAPDTSTTWRIGDGTAAFYNYVYLNIAGFCENDTFRSNQIRQGLITREEGLRFIESENKARFESIKWYLDILRLDFRSVIAKVNNIQKMY